MKKLYLGSNLKMYKGIAETEQYLHKLFEKTKDIDRENLELFIIPSYTTLSSAVQCVNQDYITIGAQNMCWEEKGQYTGEISPAMLEEMKVRLVMIGHSERRQIFKETDIEENKKVKAALSYGFTTLLCIGETEEEKEYGISEEKLRIQLKVGLHNVKSSDIENLRIAYEPVWSIGVNGTPASADYAEYMHKVIKNVLIEQFGERGREIPVLYGGSVNPQNAGEMIVQPSIDGLFIGRAAWCAEEFEKLIRYVQKFY